VLTSTYAGRRIVPLPRFTPEEWLETATRERITHAFLVPTMLTRIVHALEADPSLRPPALRAPPHGGARMPTPVLERALELLPDTGFVNAYGLTETSSTVCVLGAVDQRHAVASDDPVLRGRLASVGAPVPGIEVFLRLQRRYAHLFKDPPRTDVIEQIQAVADRNIRRFGLVDEEPATEDGDLMRLLAETGRGPQ
jgi:acyl-CoA synthetase (AMP-forming)/AMP-acid ligase II